MDTGLVVALDHPGRLKRYPCDREARGKVVGTAYQRTVFEHGAAQRVVTGIGAEPRLLESPRQRDKELQARVAAVRIERRAIRTRVAFLYAVEILMLTARCEDRPGQQPELPRTAADAGDIEIQGGRETHAGVSGMRLDSERRPDRRAHVELEATPVAAPQVAVQRRTEFNHRPEIAHPFARAVVLAAHRRRRAQAEIDLGLLRVEQGRANAGLVGFQPLQAVNDVWNGQKVAADLVRAAVVGQQQADNACAERPLRHPLGGGWLRQSQEERRAKDQAGEATMCLDHCESTLPSVVNPYASSPASVRQEIRSTPTGSPPPGTVAGKSRKTPPGEGNTPPPLRMSAAVARSKAGPAGMDPYKGV